MTNRIKDTFQRLKYVLSIVWRFDATVYFYFSVSMVFNAVYPYIAILMPRYVINTVQGTSGLTAYFKVVLVFTIIAIAIVVARELSSKAYGYRIERVRNSCFTSMLVQKVLNLKYEYLEQPATHNLIRMAWQVSWDERSGVQGTLMAINSLVSSLLALLGMVFIISVLNPVIVVLLIAGVLLNWHFLNQAKAFEVNQRGEITPLERKMEYVTETMSDVAYAKDIRLYLLVPFFVREFHDLLHDLVSRKNQTHRKQLNARLIAAVITFVTEIATYIFLFERIGRGMEIGDFLMYFFAIMAFSSTLRQIIDDITNVVNYTQCIDDVQEFFDMEEFSRDGGGKKMSVGHPSIEFVNVSFKYPNAEEYALEHLSFRIEQGEKIAIVGINGAGKTTIVKLMTGLYPPTSGKILINEEDIASYDQQSLYENVSVVFQDIVTYAFSALENVALSDDYDESKAKESLKKVGLYKKFEELSNRFNTSLSPMFEDSGIQLSGGEAQKIAIARAIYRDNGLIILDEPTAAIDPLAEYEYYQQFNDLTKDKTVIFISHRLASTRFCDSILLIENGGVMESGTHEELLGANGRYHEMFTKQSHYYQDEIGEEGGQQ